MNPEEKRKRLQQFEVLCRERGLALTVQRRRILELILGCTDHPTADRVYEDARRHLPDVSRTTVYRVLETLVEIGVITKACSPAAATRFDPVTRRHHHLACLHCDRLVDLDDGEVRHRVELPAGRRHSFEIRGYSIHFTGICAACRLKRGSKGGVAVRSAGRARKHTTYRSPKERSQKRTRRKAD